MNKKDKKNLKLDKEDVDYKHRSTTVFQNFSTHTTEMKCMEMKYSPFRNRPWFLCVCSTSLLKTLWEKDILLVTSNFSFFPTVLSIHFKSFLPFSSNLKLSSADFFSFEQSKICHWERIKNVFFFLFSIHRTICLTQMSFSVQR